MIKSKYDGIGNRQSIDMSIALDISGSMSSIDGNDAKSRITLAKESLIKLVSIMDDENDKMSLITFNHNTQKIFNLLDKKEIENKFLNDINSIKANGGTDLVGALMAAMNNIDMENINKKEKRIIMITDAYYSDVDDKLMNLFKQCVEEKGV
jgi:Mg-chelatase subunit ChlD